VLEPGQSRRYSTTFSVLNEPQTEALREAHRRRAAR
jgi:hypothetical protein